VLFGVVPALTAAQAEPADALRSGKRTTTGGASLLQRGLVIVQAALSLVLLVGAGLFAQNLSKLEHMDMKLDTTNRYIVHFNPQAAGYATTQVGALYQMIEDRFLTMPGMQKVGISTYTPMEGNNNGWGVQIQGQPDLHKHASFIKANAEYFDSVGTRVVMGRGIGLKDTSTAPAVGVVNQSFVNTFFKPGENPLGHRFGIPGPASSGDYEIVGVVEDTSYTDVKWKNHAMYFVPLMQRPASAKRPIEKDSMLYAGAIVLQTSHAMPDMEAIARRMLMGINPNLSVVRFQTFSAQIADRFSTDRMLSRLMTLFGALALLLAAVGLYGVTSYTVARRTGEIGIRMALGAERATVVTMVLRNAMMQTLLGLAIGVPVAYGCVKFVKSQLFEINSVTPGALTIAVGTLLTAALVAGLIPARRAASIEPMQALRTE
jgi:predicted permease